MVKIPLILAVVLAALAATVATPAYACACGAYIPEKPGPVVVDEKALVRWDGSTEDIVMALGVEGTSKNAAWIMPVPSAAKITLADPRLFDELAEATKPEIVYDDRLWPNLDIPFLGGSGGEAGSKAPALVEVREQQRLGPFDVTRLGADDPKALATWLGKEGFPKPPTLENGLKPYVDEGWEIVAIRLAPAEGENLGGDLEPLRLTFAAKRPVDPMRLSQAAKRPQSVQLFVLAAHKMATRGATAGGGTGVLDEFAGRIKTGSKTKHLTLFLAAGTTYMTRFDLEFERPAAIVSDIAFARSSSDEPHRATIYVERDRMIFVGPTVMGLFVLLAVVLVVLSKRNRRRRLATA